MRITFKTTACHGTSNADGSNRDHCCGCWSVSLDEDAPLRPLLECNECGEMREFVLPHIES